MASTERTLKGYVRVYRPVSTGSTPSSSYRTPGETVTVRPAHSRDGALILIANGEEYRVARQEWETELAR